MIDFWIHKLSCLGLSLLLVSPCYATSKVTINLAPRKRNPVKLRLTVKDKENGNPILDLKREDFTIFSNGQEFLPENITSPSVRLVILLDMSKSMESEDTSGQTRQQGATQAIKNIVTKFEDFDLKINLVPFGVAGESGCSEEYYVPKQVKEYLKEENFFDPNSKELKEQLDNLAAEKLCAATDLYNPLTTTIQYLLNLLKEEDSSKFSEKHSLFGIILLSDGFHSAPPRECDNDYEPELFKGVIKKVKNASKKITIHTLGYGLTPEELGKEWGLDEPATIDDVICSSEREERQKKFVDKGRLEEIANEGKGFPGFSGDGTKIAEQLEKSIKAILGEYELEFEIPNVKLGQIYDVRVKLNSDSDSVGSEDYPIRIEYFKDLSPKILIFATITAMSGLLFGIQQFLKWSNKLKEDT